MGRFLKKNYFGRYPIRNILVSKAIFRTLKQRKEQLLKRARRRSEEHIHKEVRNDEGQEEELRQVLEQGYEKVNLGAGGRSLEGFFNVDFIAHGTSAPEIVANILDLSFIPDNSLKQVHSNQVVEHLTQEQFEEQLDEYKRILKPGGRISIRCPNALGVSYGFFFGHVPENDREGFLEEGFPPDEEFQNPKDDWYVGDLYGFFHWIHAFPGFSENQHLNRITPTQMQETLGKKGYRIHKISRPEAAQLVVIASPEEG
jgi:SAM-dependent methyltransferase